jgi:hypothetical protein
LNDIQNQNQLPTRWPALHFFVYLNTHMLPAQLARYLQINKVEAAS